MRLARLEAGREQAGAEGRRRRAGLRATARVCAMVREAVQSVGIDPLEILALHQADQAAAELAALGDSPKLKRADEAVDKAEASRGQGDPRDGLATELSRVAQRCTDNSAPDPVTSSLAEWFAWALAQSWPRALKSPASSPPIDGRRLSGGRRHPSRKSR
jgi:hypothetical protein